MTDSSRMRERKFIQECIRLYKDLPVLWNQKCKHYHNRFKKNVAYDVLLEKYQEMYPEATKDDIKKKINALRTNYRKELKKCLKHPEYTPSLWYYSEFYFLQDQEDDADCVEVQMAEDGSIDEYLNLRDCSTSDIQTPSTSTIVHEPAPKIFKIEHEDPLMELEVSPVLYSRPRREFEEFERRESPERERVRSVVRRERPDDYEIRRERPEEYEIRRERPDEYENWALSCAADLRKMDPIQQIFAKNAIAAVIMEGRLGLLQRNSVKINEPNNAAVRVDHVGCNETSLVRSRNDVITSSQSSSDRPCRNVLIKENESDANN